MRAVLLAVLFMTLLAACGAPPAERQVAAVAAGDARLSAGGPSREAADLACVTEARALDTALSRRVQGPQLSEVFDQIAICRHSAAEALILAHSQGQIPRARAAADLIGLRGAMRRDVARVEGVFFRDRSDGDLRARAVAAGERQDQLTLPEG